MKRVAGMLVAAWVSCVCAVALAQAPTVVKVVGPVEVNYTGGTSTYAYAASWAAWAANASNAANAETFTLTSDANGAGYSATNFDQLSVTGKIVTSVLQAPTSAGWTLKSVNGSTCVSGGAGGGCNVTFSDGTIFNGLITANAGITATGAVNVHGGGNIVTNGQKIAASTNAEYAVLSGTSTTLVPEASITVAVGSDDASPVRRDEWLAGLKGNVTIYATTNRTIAYTNNLTPTGATYFAECEGVIPSQATVSYTFTGIGDYGPLFICTNRTYTRLENDTAEGTLFLSENDAGSMTVKPELYALLTATTTLVEFAEAAASNTVPAGTTPQYLPFSIPYSDIATNDFWLAWRLKKTSGIANTVIVGVGTGMASHVGITVDLSTLLTGYVKDGQTGVTLSGTITPTNSLTVTNALQLGGRAAAIYLTNNHANASFSGTLSTTNVTVKNLLTVNKAAETSVGEILATFGTQDDSTSYLKVQNGSSVDGVFSPGIWSLSLSNYASCFNIFAVSLDTGTIPAMIFDSRMSGSAISTRPLFDFRSYANSRMLIAGSGNVGIGVTSPSEKLDINGNALIRTNLAIVAITGRSPPATVANQCTLWATNATAGELWVTDGSGNSTLLSSENAENEMIRLTVKPYKGIAEEYNVTKAGERDEELAACGTVAEMLAVHKKYRGKVYKATPIPVADWRENEERQYRATTNAYAQWQALRAQALTDEERAALVEPAMYHRRKVPVWARQAQRVHDGKHPAWAVDGEP